MKRAEPKIASTHTLSLLRQRVTPWAIFLMLFSVTPLLLAQQGTGRSHANRGRKPAPEFQLMGENGKPVSLSDFRGKVVLLNFWATDCGGCILEVPTLVKIQAHFQGKPFTIVGISMDISYERLKSASEAWKRVRAFVAKDKVNYPVVMGHASLLEEYGLQSIPDSFLIDKHGNIAAAYHGVINQNVIANVEKNVGLLLSEP